MRQNATAAQARAGYAARGRSGSTSVIPEQVSQPLGIPPMPDRLPSRTADRPVARSEQRVTAKADALINDADRLE